MKVTTAADFETNIKKFTSAEKSAVTLMAVWTSLTEFMDCRWAESSWPPDAEKVINESPLSERLVVVFIDEVFCILTNSESAFLQLIDFVNMVHPR